MKFYLTCSDLNKPYVGKHFHSPVGWAEDSSFSCTKDTSTPMM